MVRYGRILRQRVRRSVCVVALLLAACGAALASEYHGVVTFGGVPVPGATVTLTQGGKKYVTVTDTQGFYSFPTLPDGPASIDVEMTGFEAVKQDVIVAADAAAGKWELKLLTLDAIRAALKPVASAPFTEVQARSEAKPTGAAPAKPTEKAAADKGAPAAAPAPVEERAQDGLLVQGSVNNAATSQFTLAPRFGNTASGRGLYNFDLNLLIGNSALNAQSYSLTGYVSPKPQQSQLTAGLAVQGPIKIPGLLRNGPNLFVGYQRVENGGSVITPGLVPTLAQRSGVFTVPVYDPLTGVTYQAGSTIPISSQAQALLNLYPLPNITGNAVYNYQIPLLTDTHSDAVQSFVNKTVGRKDQLSGSFGANSTRVSTGNLFNFVDWTSSLGMQGTANWNHTWNAHLRTTLTYQYSRQSTRATPFWDNRQNISGQAGITGNDQAPVYWGPPSLGFSSGLTGLSDAQESFRRNQTNSVSAVVHWNHFAHNVTGGVDFKRPQFNYLSQANPRGAFTFTGTATAVTGVTASGSDFADFLVGVPDASALAFGNADKYLRQAVYDAYLNDDWRVNPTLTINGGLRYEYGGPVTEIKNRLANLDVAPGFTAVAPVLASSPKGSLTGQIYPNSLTRADRAGIEPRIGLSWRPIPGSSMVVTAGYGITYDTSVYQGIALNLAQQSPFSESFIQQNGPGCALTLAQGFVQCGTTTSDTFGVDPNFRVGYLQTWNLIVRRDLPGSLQGTVTYLGNKGTHGAQLFLPNTNPVGAANPCPSCPTGFEYLASGGDSTRESVQLQLRRRLKSGFTASATYTYSKSIDDDAALGGGGAATLSSAQIAQNWRNLTGERGLSTFDQRNLLNATVQYTTGMGKGGGTLLGGWRGLAYKEWTVLTTIAAGSGLPETPLNGALTVAGYTSFVRPNVTGAPLYTSAGFVNRAAFTAAPAGSWGNARRDSITGPNQFTLNASMLRTFRLPDKMTLSSTLMANNVLNHVTYTSWQTSISSMQFGLPAAANSMRSVQLQLRLRY